MKRPPLVFTLPLLLGILAAQAGEVTKSTSSTSSPVASSAPAAAVTGNSPVPPTNATSRPASTPHFSSDPADCCPKRSTVPVISTPEIPPVTGQLTRMRVRGRDRTLEVMTDQIHVRTRTGIEKVVKIASKRTLAEVDAETKTYQEQSGDKADVIAYVPGRPRTDRNKLLITRQITLRLADGVVPSVFAKTTGAVRAQRVSYAPEALILTYNTATDALQAVDRLRSVPGVLDAEVMVASKHYPDFMPQATVYFFQGGPEYSPFPNSDNVEGWQCQPYLCNIRGTSAYQWWANNRVDPIVPAPLNMLLTARPDLGDYFPVEYNPETPRLHGEQADLRLPLAWEFPDKNGNPPVGGTGVRVLIVDDGIKKNHPDLRNAVDAISLHHVNFNGLDGPSNDPNPAQPDIDNHGTSMAGIIGGRPLIPHGITGVAPKCLLQSAAAMKSFVTEQQWAECFAVGTTLVDADGDNDLLDEDRTGQVAFEICVNAASEGAEGAGLDLETSSWLWKRAIEFGSTKTRNLKGCIYITSAGNGGSGHNSPNYSEEKNSPYQIPVGAISELGRRVAYSNGGCNLVCVGPSWGDELPPLLNWNSKPSNPPSWGKRPLKVNPPFGPDDMPDDFRRFTQGVPTLKSFDGDTPPVNDDNKLYDFNFSGTSAPTAMVAGVVALMLETRKDLSARDVKEILLRSCRVNNDVRVTYDGKIWPTQWRMARFGKPMHYFFGAGLIDAEKAIKIAKDWPFLPLDPFPVRKLNDAGRPGFGEDTSQRNTETGGLYLGTITNRPIPLNPPSGGPGKPVEIILANPPAGLRLENVEVRVRFYHKRRGDLEIKLVPPPGIAWEDGKPLESILYAPHRDDFTESRWDEVEALRDPTDWTFNTVLYWGTRTRGEAGNWKLVVTDMVSQARTNPTTVDDPIFVPTDNPTDVQSQSIEGAGITYHGVFDTTDGNEPPIVTLTKLRASPSTTLTKIQLAATTNSKGIFPITNWDFFDTTDIVPMQPSNQPREYFEYFPPAMAMDPEKPDELTPFDPPPPPDAPTPPPDLWPNQPLAPIFVPWLVPPEEGSMGAITSQPPWAVESPDHAFIVLRDPTNANKDTNFLYVRLNRRTGELGMIAPNVGRFSISVFAESLIGMSQPKKLEITITLPDYNSWIAVFYPGVNDPNVIGFNADPDGDGTPNGLEYAMRMDPTTPEAPVPAMTIDGTDAVFSYQEDTVATASASIQGFGAELSTDLENWTPVEPTVLSEDNFLRNLEFRVPLSDARSFVKLFAFGPAGPDAPAGP